MLRTTEAAKAIRTGAEDLGLKSPEEIALGLYGRDIAGRRRYAYDQLARAIRDVHVPSRSARYEIHWKGEECASRLCAPTGSVSLLSYSSYLRPHPQAIDFSPGASAYAPSFLSRVFSSGPNVRPYRVLPIYREKATRSNEAQGGLSSSKQRCVRGPVKSFVPKEPSQVVPPMIAVWNYISMALFSSCGFEALELIAIGLFYILPLTMAGVIPGNKIYGDMSTADAVRAMSLDADNAKVAAAVDDVATGQVNNIRQRTWGLAARVDPTVSFEEYIYWAEIEREIEAEENKKFKAARGPRTLTNIIKSRFSTGKQPPSESSNDKELRERAMQPLDEAKRPENTQMQVIEPSTSSDPLAGAPSSISLPPTSSGGRAVRSSSPPSVTASPDTASGGYSLGWTPLATLCYPSATRTSASTDLKPDTSVLYYDCASQQGAAVLYCCDDHRYGHRYGLRKHSKPTASSMYASANNPIDYQVVTKSTLIKTIEPIRTFASRPPAQYQQQATGFASQFNAVDSMVYAYSGALLFVAFLGEMRNPWDFWKGLFLAQGFICFVYILFGVFVYSNFGQYSASNIGNVIQPFGLQTAQNILALLTSFFAIFLYFNIGMKTVYLEVFQEIFNFPAITTRKGQWCCCCSQLK
ncbi:hypothetical protein KC339_g60 [Hortaea werneckii]|nr:hypothetical protein KC339_g60 [Hortaea werneckii]